MSLQIILVVLGLFAVYFLPMIVAGVREHPQQIPILLLNLFLGFTVLGWVAALVWASLAFDRKPSGANYG